MLGTKARLIIGPEHHGRRIALKLFEPAKVREGYHCELARGIIVVSEVPSYFHAMLVAALRAQLVNYQLNEPGHVHAILGSMECKLLIAGFSSERHPDLAVYLTPPRQTRGRNVWRHWFPDLVVEVVSEGSSDRDYVEKREEYWALGAKEYWIVDGERAEMLALRRGKNQWTERVLRRSHVYDTKLLPGFRLNCSDIFSAAEPDER